MKEEEEKQQPPQLAMAVEEEEEERMQQLRSKATELLLREEWEESIIAYSNFIELCQHQISDNHKPLHDHLHKSLRLALSNRAEARSRLREFSQALEDCDRALKMESTHFKTLLCKGKILLNLNRYSMAMDCFRKAHLHPQAFDTSETLNGYLEKCKKLEFLSRTGAFDLSDWAVNGFRGKPPELAEYIGPVQIKKSEVRGRGLFATKNMDAGTLLFVTKAVATERGILAGENAQLVMWKNFIEKFMESIAKCPRIRRLVSTLSSGEDENDLQVPEMSVFRPEAEAEAENPYEKLDKNRVLSILDVNSLVEDVVSAKVFGKNSEYHGVGLWVLACFINHSCTPNARRLHVGDHVMVHASRDLKAGEEITFPYFDVLMPLNKRKEMSNTWDFECSCKRCKFEEQVQLSSKQELREIEICLERGMDVGGAVYRLEEAMRRWMVRGKEKGYLRASFWAAFYEAYASDKVVKKWGRRIPPMDSVVNSIAEAVGSDERLVKILFENLKKNGNGVVALEGTLKLGRGAYGKTLKKQALRSLLDFDFFFS